MVACRFDDGGGPLLMKTIEIIPGEFAHRFDIQMAPELRAGLPSPAGGFISESIDFNRDLIQHPESTFYGIVKGDSMKGAGINDGDIAVIDRSLEAHDKSIVVAYVDNEFTIKCLDLSHKEEGYVELRSANDAYPPIRINCDEDFEVWGVVVFLIKNFEIE